MTKPKCKVLNKKKLILTLSVLTIVLLISTCLALFLGATDIQFNQLPELSSIHQSILFNIRLPRIIAAGIFGAALAVAGVCFQALLRNPLADPYILGVSGGASIGGVIALMFGLTISSGVLSSLTIPICAFVGAIISIVAIEKIARVNGHISVYNILLTGVIFNSFAAAVIYFLQSIASLQQLQNIIFYLMGRIPALSNFELTGLMFIVAIITLYLSTMGRDYNALSLGEDGAMMLGVDVESIKRKTFILGSLLTAVSVAFAGLIGFVGLVIPHILRLLLGSDHRLLLPSAALGGASFLILTDLLARTINAPRELPIGVLTALIGGPFFLYLLRSKTKHHE